MRPVHRFLVSATLLLAGSAVVGSAWALWSAAGTRSASAAAATLDPPTGAAASASAATVHVTWNGHNAPNGGADDGFFVQRLAGSTPSAACGTSSTSLTTGTACDDTSVADGTYTYKVTAVFRSWTAPSGASSSVFVDATPPAGGSIDATGLVGTNGRYSTSLALTLAFTKGSDSGSGLASTGSQVLRASAALTSNGTSDGACGTYGTFAQVGGNDPASPLATTVPTAGQCYRYEYRVPDMAGNVATYTSPDIKVDTTAPAAPAVTLTGFVNSSWDGAAAAYYRSGASNGSFTLNAGATDSASGIVSYSLPAFPSGWASTPVSLGVVTYSYSAPNPTQPSGGQTATATNNAGLQSPPSTGVTVVADATAPSGGSVTYTNGYSTAASASVSFTQGIDAGSGLSMGSGLLQRASATLAGGSCGTFGGFATVGTNPASPYSDTVTTSTCYEYRYLVSDNVGNQATFTSASVLEVDTQAPSHALSLSGPSGAFMSGTTLYYKGNATGSFVLVDGLSDAASGPASVTFPSIATTGWTHAAQTVSTPSGGPYASNTFSWSASPSNPTGYTVSGQDNAGNVGAAAITFTSDTTPPGSGSITYPDAVLNALSVPVATTNGTDAQSGVNSASLIVQRRQATLTTLTESCGAFGSFSTVTLAGGADTTVTTGKCYQYESLVSDNVGNQATYTSANVAKVDTSGPKVTGIASQQSTGAAGNGRLEVGDQLILTFNQSLDPASLQPSFTGATETRAAGLFAHDVFLTIPGITNGALDTGSPGYLTGLLNLTAGTATFEGTVALANGGTSTTVTLTVTALAGDATQASSGDLAFQPAATIKDSGGNAAGGTFTTASNFKLF